jgi:hypothetical protein
MDGETRNVNRILVGKPEGKRQFKRPRHRWENNLTWILMKACGLD